MQYTQHNPLPLPKDGTVFESVKATMETVFDWKYALEKQGLLNLYEKGKTLAWNANDLDWSIDVNIERMVKQRVANGMPALMNSLLSPPKPLNDEEVVTFQLNINAFMLSQFLHGEQGALLATAKIVQGVPWEEAKFYAANQVADEARHVEVYHRYLTEKLGLSYECTPSLNRLLDDIITDSRWDITFLGMQIMVEGLALAAFGVTRMQMMDEPLIQDLIGRVMQDESRHVAFGVLSLADLYTKEMSETELREREEFVIEATHLLRERLLITPVFERMGWDTKVWTEWSQQHPVHARLPPDDVPEDRPQPEAPRAADAARPRRLREARPAAVRAPQGFGRGSRDDAAGRSSSSCSSQFMATSADGHTQPIAAQ